MKLMSTGDKGLQYKIDYSEILFLGYSRDNPLVFHRTVTRGGGLSPEIALIRNLYRQRSDGSVKLVRVADTR